MNRGASRPHAKTPPSRQQRKAELEALVEQQRLELMVSAARWRRSAAPVDHTFYRLWRWRAPLMAAAGLALIPVVRRPAKVLHLGRQLVFGALAMDRMRRLLPGQRAR